MSHHSLDCQGKIKPVKRKIIRESSGLITQTSSQWLLLSLPDTNWYFLRQGVPWCFFPESYHGGYKIEGEVRETQLGYQATLQRRSASTIYGQDIDEVTLDVEFQTNNRVRFKVMKKGFH